MIIRNKTKKTTISHHAKVTKSILESTKGLIGERQPVALLLKTRFGIHTFGMKFPLDIIILDHENTVRYLKKRLMPKKICLWNPKFNTVLELPEGTIKKSNTEINDKLEFV